MAFGFGSFDFGFTERNPFGIRGQGVSYGGRSSSSAMQFPVQSNAGIPGVNMTAAPRVAGMSTAMSIPSGAFGRNTSSTYNQARQTAARNYVPTRASAPVKTSGSAAGTAPQARGIAATAAPKAVDPNAEYQQQIEDLYGGTANFLQGLQGSIEGSRDDVLGAVGGQFDAQRPLLDQARTELLGLNQEQRQAEELRKRNVLTDAARNYDAMQRQALQQYGGTSGTGDYARAVQGREFVRGQNTIQQESAANFRDLERQAQSIESNYQNNLQQLEAQKQAAQAQVRSDFDERIRQIDSLRAENEQAKAAAKLEALRELRTRSQAIEDQKASFQQQLEAQTLSAAQNIFSAIQAYKAEQGQPVDLRNLPGVEYSSLMGPRQSGGSELPQGYFRRPEEDQFYAQGLFAPAA